MAHKPGEKNFGGEIENPLFDKIETWISAHNNVKKKQLTTAMVELWLALPEEIQVHLLYKPVGSKDFVRIVREIVDERIAKGYQHGEPFVARRQKKKPRRKG